MENQTKFAVPQSWQSQGLICNDKYQELYKQSIESPEEFWGQQAERLHWHTKWEQVKNTSYKKPINIEWFKGGKLNITTNCIDRHLKDNADKIAFIWEPDDPSQPHLEITYKQLHEKVCRLANAYKKLGVKKGDRVTIYLPMIPEATYAMLACARIGAVHSVVFAGFSPDALADRIVDCESDFLITADEGIRCGKKIPLKENADAAAKIAKRLKNIIVVKRTGGDIHWEDSRDIWYHDITESVEANCEPEIMDAEDLLFILYTSGSTNKPKGVLHTTGGYLVYASLTHEYVFNYTPEQVYWCAADVGWVTGHSYIVYGPLSNCATSVLFEGVPTYPTASRIWEIIDKYQVNILYTAPTLVRALMQQGEEPVKRTSRKSLRLLGSVGEPINPEAWMWYHSAADERCPIVDTWWQTETGGILITPLPGATELKPGSATRPFFGIKPEIVNHEGQVLSEACEGNLCISDSWPGQMRGVYKDEERFYQTYFSQYEGKYFTGDGCKRDEDGYYWITGRVDDVLNVSGHRMGTAEIESALVEHEAVCEAAVVGFPHDIKGQGIYAYVSLTQEAQPTEELKKELTLFVGKTIGPIAKPDLIQFSPALPKTRSGKIMRRILRKIAEDSFDNLGDISTLAEPKVVDELISHRVQL